MYRDKEKQKEANRQASQKRRDKAKGMTQGNTPDANVIPKPPETVIPKRGMDIKTFDDLPLDVQASIMREPAEQRQVRTERAIRYQHLFPDRF